MDTNAKPEMSLAEIQAREYALLERFDAYCKRHGLTYCLCGGTLLGAVRHKGFIPWDDDIDLMMPRDDYERLRDLARKEPVGDFLTVRYPGDGLIPMALPKWWIQKPSSTNATLPRTGSAPGWRWIFFRLDRMYTAAWKNRLLLARIKFWIQVGKVGAGMIRPERDA